MFSRVHITPEESPAILNLCLRKTRSGKSRDYRDVIVFKKLRFQNVLCPQENGSVWTVDLTVEIKLR